jgi:hypothetical protein
VGPFVTMLQMGQFVTMIAQALYILQFECPYPRRVTLFYGYYIMSLLVLFAHFFVNRWLNKAGSKGGKGSKGVKEA